MQLSISQDALARGWYGWGSWTAPYWYVGMEPGGDHGDWPTIWADVGSPELVDCVWHCREVTRTAWHDGKIQSTWRGGVIAALAFDGKPYDRENVRAQMRTFAAEGGDIASIELSALAAASLVVERPRTLYRAERVAHIRERMEQHRPKFAIFYGIGYRNDYETIAGAFDKNGLSWRRSTLCALAAHPSRKSSTEYWAELGRKLRRHANVPGRILGS